MLPPDGETTRQRILDIALDLFIEKGFDKTSLREIAEKLGFSKAALYYHFASKDDILLTLHLRLFELGHGALNRLGKDRTDPGEWGASLDEVIGEMVANRKLFVMRERNRAAFEQLYKKGDDTDPVDPEAHFRRLLADPAVPVRDRVRLACSMGAIMGGLMLAGDVFADVPSDALGDMLREAVRDLVGKRPAGEGPVSAQANAPDPAEGRAPLVMGP